MWQTNPSLTDWRLPLHHCFHIIKFKIMFAFSFSVNAISATLTQPHVHNLMNLIYFWSIALHVILADYVLHLVIRFRLSSKWDAFFSSLLCMSHRIINLVVRIFIHRIRRGRRTNCSWFAIFGKTCLCKVFTKKSH